MLYKLGQKNLLPREGGYDYKVNETVNIVTAKITEIGQRTWGIMKGVMVLATQKVEEFSKESGPDNSKIDSSHQNENERDGCHRDFNHDDTKGWNPSGVRQSSGQQFNSVSSGSWDDWDQREHGKVGSTNGVSSHGNDGWAGWDDAKDDGFENFYQGASDKKAAGHNEKSDVSWTGGGFF